jgi:3-carboxy-cis,cis-muconate cycloisomerase
MQSHLDGVLFKNSFGTPEMRETFSTERFIETFLEVKAALARAEASVGFPRTRPIKSRRGRGLGAST